MIFGFSDLEFILIILYFFFLPFISWGFINLFMLVDSFLKVRKGYIKVWKLLPNDQTVKFWARPAGGKIKLKSSNPSGGLSTALQSVSLGKGWIWREGGVPFIKLDKDNVQIPWEANRLDADKGLSREIVDELADTSFAAGMMVGLRTGKELKMLLMFIIIIVIVTVAGIGLNYYLWSNISVIHQTVTVQNVTAAYPALNITV